MTQEEKQLLLKVLSTGLPYGVICHTEKGDGYLCSINQTIFGTEYGLNINPLKRDYFNDSKTEEQVIKPYLRSLSSMTEVEKKELKSILREKSFAVDCCNELIIYTDPEYDCDHYFSDFYDIQDWLNKKGFDYRGLIPKGLALEAPEGMYKTE